MDVWGQIYVDEWEGRAARHSIERDDGLIDTFESAAHYFKVPRSEPERELLDSLDGPVLDLACGAGSHALYLENRGLEVTAVDASPGAIRVCLARGCRDARVMDLRSLDLPDGHFRSIIVMGNTLGAHQTPDTLPELLRTLRIASTDSASLVCATIDPLMTDEEAHLHYHRRNRERGLPPGLTRIRMGYGDLVDDWIHLWLPTGEELATATLRSGWRLLKRDELGPYRLDRYVTQD